LISSCRSYLFSENGCGKWHLWSEIGSGFGDAGKEYPPGIKTATEMSSPGDGKMRDPGNEVARKVKAFLCLPLLL